VDARLVMDVTMLRFRNPITSQKDVGGWPDLGDGRQARLGIVVPLRE
jgi:hypothetical protein